MIRLPILYARGNNGKVLEWEMFVEDDTFWTVSGAQGFQKVVSARTECHGKNIGRSNETDPRQQAMLEATARWDKRKKSGGYWENVADIDKVTFVEPMLARNLKDRKDKLNPGNGLILQRKFNGLRCLATKAGLFTRKGEAYVSVPHLEESLTAFFEEFPEAVLDGELYNWDLREQLNEIVKLCRKTVNLTADDFFASRKMVRYYVYDGFGFGAKESDPYVLRKDKIDYTLTLFCKYFERVEDFWFHSWDEMEEVYQGFLSEQEEGGMVRIPESPYERGKRSNNLLKLKPTEDAEYVITSIREGNGNWSGVAKIIGLRMPNGKEFDATFKGTMAEALACLTGKDYWIGRTVTIQYFGFTGLGTPNFAQFDYKNCIKG